MGESALVIGVNKTGGLPPLSGAVSGAEDFADWARSQGMSVVLITDDNGAEVSVSDIQDEIDKILAPGNCTKLIVYFSGHGFLQGANTEVWLLTKAPKRDQEAVNVRLSMDNARYSRIPHVIFVSDACRSGGPTHQHRGVTGASIFGAPTTYEYDGKIDSFYATRPGDVALEYKDENEAVSNFKGLFTECLLTALNGNVPTLVTKIESNGNERWVIQSEQLETHLETNVPIEAANISIKLSQKPQIIPESRLPQFFGELTNPTQSVRFGSGGGNIPQQPGAQRLVSATRSDILLLDTKISLASEAVKNDEEQAFVGQVNSLISATGRDHFETETGFTVYGNACAVTTPNGWDAELFVEDGVNQIRLVPASYDTAGSILIEFDQGIGTVLAANPGYIGTVVVEDDKVVSVNYTPSRHSLLYKEEYEPRAEGVNRRRAFAATAMRHGLFELEGEDTADVGEYLRMDKKLDPALGIYASYAYQQAGRLKSIRSVLEYMANDGGVVPYDVLLLARQEEPWPLHAPFCPMLRQGWALLELHPLSLERLMKYRSELLPSLWTLFTPEGTARIRDDLESGQLQ